MQTEFLIIRSLLLALTLALPCVGLAVPEESPEESEVPSILGSTPRHKQVSRMVTRFVERAHYSRAELDDDLSEAVLNKYIEALDVNKHYFLESDIIYFSRYNNRLDDVLRSGQLDPIFDIFRLYRLRAQQHLS